MVEGKNKQDRQLTKDQKEVLELIINWLVNKEFSVEDQKEAERIWKRFNSEHIPHLNDKSIKNWAAAVIYTLGRKRGYRWLSQAYLGEEFSIAPTGISQRWRALTRAPISAAAYHKKERFQRQKKEAMDFFNPTAAEVFRKLMTYTQQSEKWKSYVGEIFYSYVGSEAPPLPIDLILELLIFITCDRTLPNGRKIIDYFLNEESFSEEEQDFLQELKKSRFGLFEVEDLGEDVTSWLHVKDLYRDLHLRIWVKELTGIEEGDIIMSRIIPLSLQGNSSGHWKIGGSLVTLHPPAARELEELAKRWFWEFSVANKGWATGEGFIQENSFLFWRWLLGQ